jgi:hypothetical protein
MKHFAALLMLGFLISGCSLDQCDQTITYTKMSAIYADLDLARVDDLVESAREIEKPGKIYVSEELLIIGDSGTGIHIIDNTDPSNPVTVSFLNVPGSTQLYVEGDYIYSNAYYDMLKIDISDMNNIRIADRMIEAFPVDQRNFENHALIGFDVAVVTEQANCDDQLFDGGRFFFDDRDVLLDESAIPTSFISNGSVIGTANRMAVSDESMFVINRSQIFSFDIADNQISEHKAYNFTEYIGWQMETIFAQDELLYIGSQNGMSIHRLANTSIQWEGEYFHATGCDPVLPIEGGIAYLTLRNGDDCPGDVNSLNVLDINNSRDPFLLQEIEMSSPFGLSLIGDLLYVGEGNNGLRVFDATNRSALSEISYNRDISAYDIIPHPTRTDIVLLASEQGLVQYGVNGDQFDALSEILF